jgi:MerR family mercuric resistance operon transcriptional regulator
MHRSIGETATLTGCNIETIRYYERVGLLSQPPRTGGGHRMYDEAGLARLKFIRRSRELGFPLGDVRTLLGLADRRSIACAEVRAVTATQLRTVRAKLADLGRMERVLAELVRRCAGEAAPDCPIIEALSGDSVGCPGPG